MDIHPQYDDFSFTPRYDICLLKTQEIPLLDETIGISLTLS